MKPLRLSTEIHRSYLIGWWCLGMVIGVIAAMSVADGYFSGWIWLVVAAVLAVYGLWRARRILVIVMVMSGLMFGLWRGSIDRTGLDNYQQLIGQTVKIKGSVMEDPDVDKHESTVLRLKNIVVEDQVMPGTIWVRLKATDAIWRSDLVEVSGKVSEGFGSFSASIYRAQLLAVERPIPGDVAVGVRNWFSDRVRSQLPAEETALGMGYLTGLRRSLPPDLADALKIAGLTHVIVASGYNLTILVRLCRRLFSRVSKYLAAASSVAMVVGFMALTGMSPSMSRAGWVTGLSLAAWYFGRTIHPLVLLPLAAAATLIINPQYGWNDLGWQLSFAAFAGVIILAPLLQRYFFGDKPPGTIRQVLGETISAQLMTLPLLVVAFGLMSNISLIANMLVVPLVPIAMLLTFLTGVFASVPLLGWLIAQPTQWLLGYMIGVAKWLAGQSWAVSEVPSANVWWLIIGYGAIGLIIWYLVKQTNYRLRQSNIVE